MSLVEKDLGIFLVVMTVIIICLLITFLVLLVKFMSKKRAKENFAIAMNEREHCEKTCIEKLGADKEECVYDCLQFLFKRGGQTAQLK